MTKLYNIKWIALIGDTVENHTHEFVEATQRFENAQDAIEWAKSRLTIEVQECDDKGEIIPLMDFSRGIKNEVDWDFWHPGKVNEKE